eukprot:GHVS01050626.1.p1 GENE.GHVS01050626.1~~GHVS01050626.1.p1  ORF type:complete len:221 (-),score=8.06 GHVS01050626.1:72-734(-)
MAKELSKMSGDISGPVRDFLDGLAKKNGLTKGNKVGPLYLHRCQWNGKNTGMIIAIGKLNGIASGVSKVSVEDNIIYLTLDTENDWDAAIDIKDGGSWSLKGFAAYYEAVNRMELCHVDKIILWNGFDGEGSDYTGSKGQKLSFAYVSEELVVKLEEKSPGGPVTNVMPFNVSRFVKPDEKTLHIFLKTPDGQESGEIIKYSYNGVTAYKFDEFSPSKAN